MYYMDGKRKVDLLTVGLIIILGIRIFSQLLEYVTEKRILVLILAFLYFINLIGIVKEVQASPLIGIILCLMDGIYSFQFLNYSPLELLIIIGLLNLMILLLIREFKILNLNSKYFIRSVRKTSSKYVSQNSKIARKPLY